MSEGSSGRIVVEPELKREPHPLLGKNVQPLEKIALDSGQYLCRRSLSIGSYSQT